MKKSFSSAIVDSIVASRLKRRPSSSTFLHKFVLHSSIVNSERLICGSWSTEGEYQFSTVSIHPFRLIQAASRIQRRNFSSSVGGEGRFLSREEIEKSKREDEDNIWDDKAQETGMDLVFRRAGNILQAVTERKMTKLLQLYSGGKMLQFFDPVRDANWLDVTGISESEDMVAECK